MLPRSPYRGIEPFRYSDHPIFFARDVETRELLRLVIVYRGVLLYGDSGAGKSSLVNAGLIPAAAAEGFRADRIRVRPRRGEELVVERIPSTDDESSYLPSSFASHGDDSSLVLSVDALRALLGERSTEDNRPLLVFDQFEELITLFEEAPEGANREEALASQHRIVDALVELLRDETLPVKLLFSFRQDHLAKVKQLFARRPELIDQSLALSPPATNALTRIIRGPFEDHPGNFGNALSPALAERLRDAFQLRSAAGAINLSEVQIVCLRLWNSADPEAHLTERQGIQGILEDYHSESLGRFPEEGRYVAVALLSHMVTRTGARNVISRDDLMERVLTEETNVTEEQLKRTLNALESERLIRCERRPDLDVYEISSEFLVPWIRRQRQDRLKAREQARLERQLVEKLEEQRRTQRRKLIAMGGSFLLVVASAFALVALVSFLKARSERDTSRSQLGAATAVQQLQSDPQAAVFEAMRALDIKTTDEAEEALRSALVESHLRAVLEGHDGTVSAAAFSPDGLRVVTAGDDGTARIWELATGDVSVLRVNTKQIVGASFTAGGKRVVTVDADGVARISDAATGTFIVRIGKLGGAPLDVVVFSPDGRRVVTARADGAARISDAATGTLVARLGEPGDASLRAIAFTPDGTRVLTVDADGAARMSDAATGKLIARLRWLDNTGLYAMAFSPDGKRIVTAGTGGAVRIWDVPRANVVLDLPGHKGIVLGANFSPDGRRIVTASDEGTARVWDSGVIERAILIGREDPPYAVSFSPDGRSVAIVGDGGTVRVWSGEGDAQWTPRASLGKRITGVSFSRDGKLVVTTSVANVVRIRDLERGPTGVVLPPQQALTSASLDPEGKRLVTVGAGATLWDVDVGRSRAQAIRKIIRPDAFSPVVSAAFSPDGKRLVTVKSEQVAVWDARTGAQLGEGLPDPPGEPVVPVSAVFSSKGLLATAYDNGTVKLWDLQEPENPKSVAEVRGHSGPQSVAFSSNGEFVLTSSDDGTARVWEARSGRLLAVLRGGSAAVKAAAFDSADAGAGVLTVGADGIIRHFTCEPCLPIGELVRGLAGWSEREPGGENP